MAYATLTFSAPINASCQVGDIAYYVETDTAGGFEVGLGLDEPIVKIGDIRQITGATTNAPVMIVETTLSYQTVDNASGSFIMFTKDNKANLSSPLGYYASVKLVNTSKTVSEMFSVGMEVYDSSSESQR